MKCYIGLDDIDSSPKVVTLGNFDGVHKGHKELIKQAVKLGHQRNIPSYVLSFYPHPRFFFKEDLKYINTLEEKNKNIKELGVEALVVMEFNKEIAHLTKDSFIEEILVKKMNAKIIVVGFDFVFGKNREGNVETLKETAALYGIEVYIIPPVTVEGERVSSTLIREYFGNGQIEKAKKLLGYYPKISGTVIKGKQIGRTIGFPTANINYDKEQLVPANGVYSVEISVKGITYPGISNIGIKPTVKNNELVEIEVHLISFSEDIYGEEVVVTFIKKIRDEMKFSSLYDLKDQIKKDIDRVLDKSR